MVTDQFKGKNVLFFLARTFGLEEQIGKKLESLGASVTFYDERLKDSTFTKGIIRLRKELYQKKINTYYRNILKEVDHKAYDFLFVIRGEVVPEFFLKAFRKAQPNCTCIFYNWDSFTNTSHSIKLLKYYDRALTFDPEDAKCFNIHFRPLFFFDGYKEIKKDTAKADIDILFLGTAHSDRYIISNRIKEWAISKGIQMLCYYYMHGKLVYFFKKFFDKSFRYFDYKKLSFKPLSFSEIISYYKRSKAILDINHPKQKGLTLRTFEAIGAQRKLITTNSQITKFPFYNMRNFFVIDRDAASVPEDFIQSPYLPLDDDIYDRLSIEGWLYNIFFDFEDEFWQQCL
ncbi:hypothetical protein [Parapedobacter sp. DT-150]|uniref:hypothetical protein n=1 Tax=Parapedobacter sp. DT-150 TaxID=3396162 RepID=UPI003F1DD71C